jgi:hypothetical protein
VDAVKSRGITQENVLRIDSGNDEFGRSTVYCFIGLPGAFGGQVTVDFVGRGFLKMTAYLDLNFDDQCSYVVVITDQSNKEVAGGFYLVTY